MRNLIIFILTLGIFTGCASKYNLVSSKNPQSTATETKPEEQDYVNEINLFLDPLKESESDIRNKNFEKNFDLKVIYFDFDSFEIKPEYVELLKNNAEWLKKNQNYYVLIEGHTDQRGTNEYNLALGQQRASKTRAYLSYLGINPKRIATISYGEEKLAVKEESEEAYAKNRRSEFLIFADKKELDKVENAVKN